MKNIPAMTELSVIAELYLWNSKWFEYLALLKGVLFELCSTWQIEAI